MQGVLIDIDFSGELTDPSSIVLDRDIRIQFDTLQYPKDYEIYLNGNTPQ